MTDKPIQLAIRPIDLANARRHLNGRLISAIQHAASMGDIGLISQITADLRALDFVGCTQADPEQPKPAVTAEVTKDADTVAVRAQTQQRAKQERQEAERAETHGEDAVEQAAAQKRGKA